MMLVNGDEIKEPKANVRKVKGDIYENSTSWKENNQKESDA